MSTSTSSTTWPKPSPRYAEYVRKVSRCGHWTVGRTTDERVILALRDDPTVTVSYERHDGGNDRNSPRNFAAEAGRACGCRFVEPRGRKRSRKPDGPKGYDPDAARRASANYHRRWGETIVRLQGERDVLIRRAERSAAEGTYAGAARVPGLLCQIADIERRLRDDFHQPVDPFDPYTLDPFDPYTLAP